MLKFIFSFRRKKTLRDPRDRLLNGNIHSMKRYVRGNVNLQRGQFIDRDFVLYQKKRADAIMSSLKRG